MEALRATTLVEDPKKPDGVPEMETTGMSRSFFDKDILSCI